MVLWDLEFALASTKFVSCVLSIGQVDYIAS